jgi:signal recognition particle receptor subunit beta
VSFIDLSKNEVQCKIVYYGPGRGGKTTNLLYLHQAMTEAVRGKMVTIDTKGDRTLFFDFLPLALGKIQGLSIKIQLYTVDGFVVVADSLKVQKEKNVESLENLRQNLAEDNLDIKEVPLVLQFNKRDLGGSNIPILTVEEMEEDLNSGLQVPWFSGSALKGDGVFETLREISKRTVKYVSRKLLSR